MKNDKHVKYRNKKVEYCHIKRKAVLKCDSCETSCSECKDIRETFSIVSHVYDATMENKEKEQGEQKEPVPC